MNSQPVHVRMRPDDLVVLDRWISEQPYPQPTRPDALRRLAMERLRGHGHLGNGHEGLRPDQLNTETDG